MTSNFTKRNSQVFFSGKRAILKREITNLGGKTIKADTEVIITSKSMDLNWCLNIKDEKTRVEIRNVDCEDLDLIKEHK